ncbi:hypothetical protein MNBD_GAMMA09-363 [hydrothermal vent metagenome]|uniref:Rap1a immunity protein domain-containing protein n=1 Tax=hydrothermal vent metagenome TaxID=652676 RepID=A0A3B0XHS5_9ZZZZ
MLSKITFSLLFCLVVGSYALARDFEGGYAVYGAGGESCKRYSASMKKGGQAQDYFTDWSIGYLTAFNVIMPSTYDVLGETEFSSAQSWLQRRCEKYPNELFITAVIRLTEVLHPMRYQSSLKKPVKAKPAPKKTITGKSAQKK